MCTSANLHAHLNCKLDENMHSSHITTHINCYVLYSERRSKWLTMCHANESQMLCKSSSQRSNLRSQNVSLRHRSLRRAEAIYATDKRRLVCLPQKQPPITKREPQTQKSVPSRGDLRLRQTIDNPSRSLKVFCTTNEKKTFLSCSSSSSS